MNNYYLELTKDELLLLHGLAYQRVKKSGSHASTDERTLLLKAMEVLKEGN